MFHTEMMQAPWQVALVSGLVHTIVLTLMNEVQSFDNCRSLLKIFEADEASVALQKSSVWTLL